MMAQNAPTPVWNGNSTFMPNRLASRVRGRITTLNAVSTFSTSFTRCEITDSFVSSSASTTSL